jgi:hypothetical protein
MIRRLALASTFLAVFGVVACSGSQEGAASSSGDQLNSGPGNGRKGALCGGAEDAPCKHGLECRTQTVTVDNEGTPVMGLPVRQARCEPISYCVILCPVGKHFESNPCRCVPDVPVDRPTCATLTCDTGEQCCEGPPRADGTAGAFCGTFCPE